MSGGGDKGLPLLEIGVSLKGCSLARKDPGEAAGLGEVDTSVGAVGPPAGLSSDLQGEPGCRCPCWEVPAEG